VRKILADLIGMSEHGLRSEVAIAAVYVNLGEKDKALEWLERAYEQHLGNSLNINTEPTFEGLRPAPKFQALLKKIGFPDAADQS
jgi:hypothetical protein